MTGVLLAIPTLVTLLIVTELTSSLLCLLSLPSVLSVMLLFASFTLNTNIVATGTLVKTIANLVSILGLVIAIACLALFYLMAGPGVIAMGASAGIVVCLILAAITSLSGLLLRTRKPDSEDRESSNKKVNLDEGVTKIPKRAKAYLVDDTGVSTRTVTEMFFL